MSSRSSIFAPRPELDVSGFAPKSGTERRPDPSEIDDVRSERFRSREPDGQQISDGKPLVNLFVPVRNRSAAVDQGFTEGNPEENLQFASSPRKVDHQPPVGRSSTEDEPSAGNKTPAFRQPTDSQPTTTRVPRVYRTGRNVTISVKTTGETVEAFYAIAESQGWKVSETFERAVALLQRDLDGDLSSK